ncbi:twin-arginine translocase subunit TatC [Alteribacillus sp. YIM 98480]|uniref:twin-arginine translocase subunit TatC n=1 Tax=Alteribacillus sp. YIM 98480 TaxID=2606599 RepID=UPI00131DB7C9|nr:twin-arginine translocase subunit TatC [Alteribacillus sp. YIM 98480]
MEKAMSAPLLNHLEELRIRIIITGGCFILFFLLSFLIVDQIYSFLIKDVEGKLAVLGPGDILWVYVALAALASLILTIPIAAYQLWSFVAPALEKQEKRATFLYVPVFLLLFVIGLAFGFYIVFPLMMNFLVGIADGQFETMFTVDRYFKFLFQATVPLALFFELPVIVLFLTHLGIINPHQLAAYRKYAYFILIIISVLISPPDFLSDVLIIGPLLILYEVSIILSQMVYRRKKN